jgi:outer membrane protein TolC
MKYKKINIKTVFVLCSLFFVLSTQSQELKTLIQEGLTNNPEIQKFKLQYSIASEKINEANSLPNTQIGVGYFVSEPETRTGAQRFKISAKQMLPAFGAITARENYATSLADAVYVDVAIAKRKLVASISQSYYRLYALKAKQTILIENSALLKTYETLALNSVEVGKASLVDVLRLQMRQNELEQLSQVLEQDFLAEQTNFNKHLNRDKDIAVNVTNDLKILEDTIDAHPDNLSLHPELLKYDKLYESVEKSELLNQKQSSAMFGFGLDYVNVEKRPDANFIGNGKDILMPMVSLSIPIFNNKYKSKTKQNTLQKQEITFKKQERLNTLETLLDKAIKQRVSALISYQTQSKNLKQAKYAEAILIKSYETGTIDFNDVLDIQELQLKFQMSQVESKKMYYVQTTFINYLSN